MFTKISSFKNLLTGYFKARRRKRHKRRLQKIEVDFEHRLINIQRYLQTNSYRPGAYHRFLVYEPKMRQVSAPAFIDRIVHQALFLVVEPLFESQFIENTFACRKGKGTHFGMRQIALCLQLQAKIYPVFYALKCDIKSYFASIDHQVLFSLLSQTISCPKTLVLLKIIIDSYEDSPGCGIPIGNLTSQLFANVYLHPLDIYVTKVLKEPNYFRYMDDFVILSQNLDYLLELRQKIRMFLQKELKLNLHPKKANIFRADRGLDFLGYLIKPEGISLRKKTLRRFKRRHKKRLLRLNRFKKELKIIKQTPQLSLFDDSIKDKQIIISLEDKITCLQTKLRSSRASLKGFLRYSNYQRLDSGGVKVGGIVIPKIFPIRKKKIK